VKIFFGVQATGNGHITRARALATKLQQTGAEVTYQFTGREREKLFEMEVFGEYRWCSGLTFETREGHVRYLKTARTTNIPAFVRDVTTLDLREFDGVISDFEPVTSWAAHQYAFNHAIPRKGADPLANQVMKHFAPADIGVGLHWHHFGQAILPPIIDTPQLPRHTLKQKVVVYLPFEEPEDVMTHLAPFKTFDFHVYAPKPIASKHAHIDFKPLSREGFQADLYDCAGIISNAGFELASESLQLGKKILAKPLHAQMEQISNAAALEQLGYGHTMFDFDAQTIERWLHDAKAVRVTYPDVAKLLVQWLIDGKPAMDDEFIERVWRDVQVLAVDQ